MAPYQSNILYQTQILMFVCNIKPVHIYFVVVLSSCVWVWPQPKKAIHVDDDDDVMCRYSGFCSATFLGSGVVDRIAGREHHIVFYKTMHTFAFGMSFLFSSL